MTPTTRRRADLCDAAIDVIARSGLRGLTHRAVDQAAGVAEGSTSYYFRTRHALLTAVTQRLLATDLADVPSGTTAPTWDALADTAARTVAHWVGPGRVRMLARYEISLESLRQPELRAEFVAAGAGIRDQAVRFFAAQGVSDPERRGRDFIACLDGLVYDQLAGAGGPRSTSDIRRTVRELLAAMTADHGAQPQRPGTQP